MHLKYTVWVGHGKNSAIYAFRDCKDAPEFLRYQMKEIEEGVLGTVYKMQAPSVRRVGPSLVNFRDSWIFVISGEKLHQVEAYSIQNNKWYAAPNINKVRADASSCSQGRYIYAFGGL